MPEAQKENKKEVAKSERRVDEKPAYPAFSILGILKRVWAMLTKKERHRAGLLFIGIIINSFVDIIGLAAVVPVIGLVINPELIHENEYLARAFELTSQWGIDTERKFLMLTSIALVAAFLFKALVNLGLNLIQTRYSFAIGHRISGLMWQYHFSQSLERMRSTESGRVLSEINGWPLNLANTFVVGNLRFINELMVIAAIAVGLVIYEPIVLISVAILLTIGAMIIRKGTKNRLDRYSEIRKIVGPQTGTLINNAVRGFLEVMSFRASDAIRNGYLNKTRLLYRIGSNSQIMNMAPAKLYEVLAVTAVSAAIFISLLLGESNEAFLNLLIVMALSAYRVMPSMTRLNGHVMGMRSSYHVINVIESALQSWAANTDNPDHPEHIPVDRSNATWPKAHITLNGLTIGYKSLPEPVLANLNCTFEPGCVHAIVGPSGSGKSTLVNTILGLHPAISGGINVGDGEAESAALRDAVPVKAWLANIGYLSQQPFLFNGTVLDNLTMRVPNMTVDEAEVNRLIERLDLTDCLGETPLEFELLEGGNNLSGGQQQRLAILRALRIQRPVLILDEATSALDGLKRDAVFELLRKRANAGTNVLLITHDMSLAEQCDTILDLGDDQAQPVQRFNDDQKKEKK
jgi:ABC-type multidrug transport system fused ATPase/permease subunit